MQTTVSLKKSLIGLIEHFKERVEKQALDIYDNTIIRKLPTYLKKIAQTYPAYKNEIVE